MKVFLRILAMVFLVAPAQQLVRGLWSGLFGQGYEFSAFGLSSTVIIVVSIVMILISLFLFRATEPFFKQENKG